jgi:dynein heavy chain, axonemal
MDRLLPAEKHVVEDLISSIGKRWGKNTDNAYYSDILNQHDRSYEEIADLEKVLLSVTTSLNNYNLISDKPMDLVLFDYALKHMLIILRIIRQPKSSALLIGLGGSGRKSFAQLASFIAEYTPMTLEITKNYGYNQFREDIKKIFTEIGLKNKFISFLFSDTQIKDEQFLEDINNILNVGTVPNLFNVEERVEICETVRKDAAEELGSEIAIERIF